MKILAAILMSVLVARGSGAPWSSWFEEEEVIQAQEDITEECLRLAGWGQCAFYDCLERRFPCGDGGYTERLSKHFCSKIDSALNTFDTFGRLWLNRTSICLVGDMVPLYNSNSLKCSDIQNAGIESIVNCNGATVDGKTFCEFTSTNGDAYDALMGSDEMGRLMSLRDIRVVTSMIGQAMDCGVQSLSARMSSVVQSIGDFGSRIGETISSWFS